MAAPLPCNRVDWRLASALINADFTALHQSEDEPAAQYFDSALSKPGKSTSQTGLDHIDQERSDADVGGSRLARRKPIQPACCLYSLSMASAPGTLSSRVWRKRGALGARRL